MRKELQAIAKATVESAIVQIATSKLDGKLLNFVVARIQGYGVNISDKQGLEVLSPRRADGVWSIEPLPPDYINNLPRVLAMAHDEDIECACVAVAPKWEKCYIADIGPDSEHQQEGLPSAVAILRCFVDKHLGESVMVESRFLPYLKD